MASPRFTPVKLEHELATTSAGLRVLAATGISQYGDWLTTVALLTVLYTATNSALGPAAYMLFRVAPRILGAPVGGHLADRYSPQRVAAFTMAAQGLATVGMLASVASHNIPLIYITVALSQVAGAASRPLFPALIGIHAPRQQRGTFNSLDQMLTDTSIFIGPAVGAVLLPFTGANWLLALDCATFAVAAAFAISLPNSRPGGVSHQGVGIPAAAGARFAWRDPGIRIVGAAYTLNGAIITVMQAILVVAAAERFGGANRIGYCYAALGVGGVLAGLVALRLRHHTPTPRDLYATALFEAAPLVGLAFCHSLAPALALLFICGLGGSLNWIFASTYMQNQTPVDILGRVSAALLTVNFAGMIVGAVVALAFATWLGWATLMLAFTCICLALLTLIAFAAQQPGTVSD